MDSIIIKIVETPEEWAGALAVRFRVFVDEQNVPQEEELDAQDATATHAIAIHRGHVVGTGRMYQQDVATARIGRMAVDQSYRRLGVGSELLDYLEGLARAQGVRRALLHAQEYVKQFYAGHGYREHGAVFLEANIRHVEMRKEL